MRSARSLRRREDPIVGTFLRLDALCAAKLSDEVIVAVRHSKPLDRTFHALGDWTRRRMLGLLAQRGECTAGDLGKPFDIAQPTASKHIRVLEEAGLVSRRVNGRVHLFRLESGPMNEAEVWLVRHREFWKASLDALEEYLKGLSDREGRKS